MNPIAVKVKKLHPEAKLPVKSSKGAACFDVYSIENKTLHSGEVEKIRTGLSFEVPEGFEIEIRPRSGLSNESVIIANSPGTLDSDYRGELIILMLLAYPESFFNHWHYDIQKGQRIAQIKLNRVYPTEFIETEELSTTERGSGGFGSTGK